MKCKRETDGRAIDHQALEVLRMQAIKAVGRGQSVRDVAAAYGLNTRTIYRWLSRFASGGQKALQAKPIPGRSPQVSPEEMRWIARAVRDECPQQFKFSYGLWTLSLIRNLIERQFGQSLSLASVSRIMKLLGVSVQRPLYEAWQQDPVLVQKWESETYPEIRAEARRVGASINFADEAGIRSDHHTGSTWAPVGETPVVKATGRRISLNMVSAVSPRGEFRFMVHEGTFTAAVFKRFLQRLLIRAKRPIFLIADGHPTHKAKLVKSFVESTDGQLKLFFLPAY